MNMRCVNNNWITINRQEFILVCVITIFIFGIVGFVGGQFYRDAVLGVIGTAFIAGLYLFQFIFLKKDTFLHKSVVPGMLSGIILAADYHWFFIVLPSILAILFYAGKQKILKILLIIAVILATLLMMVPISFYLFVPLSVLDYDMLWNLNTVQVCFLVLGLLAIFIKNRKKAIILVSFPATFILYVIYRGYHQVCSQELVPVIAVCSLVAAAGIIMVYRFLTSYPKLTEKKVIPVAFLALAIGLTAVLPVFRSIARENETMDSRHRALTWIKENIGRTSIIMIPRELNMDIASLHQDYHIWTADFKYLRPGELQNLSSVLGPAYLLIPDWGYAGRDLSVKKTVTQWQTFTSQMDILTTFPGNQVPVINLFSPGRVKNPGFQIFYMKTNAGDILPSPVVWNNKGRTIKQLCPGLKQKSRYGTFRLQVNKDTEEHFLVANNTSPDKNGKRNVTLTYEVNHSGVHMEIPGGYYLHFIVSVSVSPGLINRSNSIFIADFCKNWEKQEYYPLSQYWQYHLVSKKIRPGSTQLQMGIRFAPQSPEDQLRVRDVRIVVTEKPLNAYNINEIQ